MFVVVTRILLRLTAIFLVGIVIKLTDDFLDDYSETDLPAEKSLAQKLGRGVAAYGLLFFAVAVSLDAGSVCTLFFAAYAVGMFKDPNLVLPTYFPAWLESVLVITGGILLWGWYQMASSLTIMLVVQLADDYLDQKVDWLERRSNLVQRWGKIEVLLLTIIAAVVSLQLDWEKAILVLVLTPVVNLVTAGPRKRRSCL